MWYFTIWVYTHSTHRQQTPGTESLLRTKQQPSRPSWPSRLSPSSLPMGPWQTGKFSITTPVQFCSQVPALLSLLFFFLPFDFFFFFFSLQKILEVLTVQTENTAEAAVELLKYFKFLFGQPAFLISNLFTEDWGPSSVQHLTFMALWCATSLFIRHMHVQTHTHTENVGLCISQEMILFFLTGNNIKDSN